MNKTLALLGASTVFLAAMSSGSEARLVRYEINGKQYTYSSNNRTEATEARKRIAAAKAAKEAKAKAEAERNEYPLVAAFGSKLQTEAKEAEARLQKLLSGKSQPSETARSADEDRSEQAGRAQDRPQRGSPPAKPAQQAVVASAAPMAPMADSAPEPVPAKPQPAVAEPLDTPSASKVKSVSFDVESGIKTIIKADGTIEEEPFDSSVLSQLTRDLEKANSLMAFVKQLRETSVETTGSIRTSVAEQKPEIAIKHR
ncbi:hypothetical protein GGR34_001114 [Microvirga flocculans]|uniref:Uncharacterized protein n=1 Tax=Microvirga flocculans TaxID=217168 RepID=A0A7W6IDH6_9HYPH|nr:hypothetical protein [Microvirga flocculans]MBB4039472.1 hypothetical protein [Microvirga flocculans]